MTRFLTLSTAVLGGGSLAFAGWALLQPDSFARATGIEPDRARIVGVRDFLCGVLILARRDPLSFALRGTADASDAVTLAEARPGVAAGAAAFAVWAMTAALVSARR